MPVVDVYEVTFKKPVAPYTDLREVARHISSFNRILKFNIVYYVVRTIRDGGFNYSIVVENPSPQLLPVLKNFYGARIVKQDSMIFAVIDELDENFIDLIEKIYEKAVNIIAGDRAVNLKLESGRVVVSEGNAFVTVRKSGIDMTSEVFMLVYELFDSPEIMLKVNDSLFVIPDDVILAKFGERIVPMHINVPKIKINIRVSKDVMDKVSAELLDEFAMLYRDKILGFEEEMFNRVVERVVEIGKRIYLDDEDIETIKEVLYGHRIDVSIDVSVGDKTMVEMVIFNKEYVSEDIPSDVIITSLIYKYYNILLWSIIDRLNDLLAETPTLTEISKELSRVKFELDANMFAINDVGLENKDESIEILIGGESE